MMLSGQRNECPTCGERFNSNAAFDRHRRGVFSPRIPQAPRHCATPEQMTEAGMTRNAGGWWITRPFSPDAKKARSGVGGGVVATGSRSALPGKRVTVPEAFTDQEGRV